MTSFTAENSVGSLTATILDSAPASTCEPSTRPAVSPSAAAATVETIAARNEQTVQSGTPKTPAIPGKAQALPNADLPDAIPTPESAADAISKIGN